MKIDFKGKLLNGSQLFYAITSPEELAWFAEQVNEGEVNINGLLKK